VKVAAIVPAYNEATRIEGVLQVLLQCPQLHERLPSARRALRARTWRIW